MCSSLGFVLAASPFIPHGHCYLWQPSLVWLHVLSDGLIALAYFSIPVTLVYFVRQRRDLPFNGLMLLFAAFIVFCGLTHIASIWTLWYPTYWVSGTLKALTAFVSVATALQLAARVPVALKYPSPAQLEAANQALQTEVAERQRVEAELRQAQIQLEQRVEERTAALSTANQQLQLEVAERQRTMVAAKRSHEQFQTLVEDAPDAIFIADAAGRCTQVNTNACRLLGYPQGYLQGLSVADLFVPSDQSRLSALRQQLQAGMTQVAEWTLVDSQGQPIPVEISSKIHQDGRWQSFVRDLRPRKAVEAQMRSTEERLSSLMAANVIGLVFCDIHGRIYDANDEMLRIIGYTREDLAAGDLRWTNFTPPEYLAQDRQNIATAQASGSSPPPFEKEYVRKDGSRVPVLVGFTLLDSQEEVVAFILDLTQRKQAETERDQLLQREQAARQEAERANRIKDEFLAVLSHELRSPLNPILGWATLLRSGRVAEDKLPMVLETIERNVRLQLQLVDDLLDVSRILRGKLAMKMEPVNLAEVISAAVETVGLAAEAKDIAVAVEADATLPSVLGDSGRLQQVVWNLVTNAVKFTPQGGRVQLQVSVLAAAVELRVMDTGKGIKPEFLPYIFDSFRQEDGATTREFGGLGLGLAIVRHIVEMHGGTVTALSSGEGQGATFTVRLPQLRSQLPTAPKPPDPAALTPYPLAGVAVLVIEDDADSRQFLTFVLEERGAAVTAVATAAAALEQLAQVQPAVLVSDIGMPEMDGYELMRRVRRQEAGEVGLVAVALTAYARDQDRERAEAAGFDLHLSKPVDSQLLVRCILELLRRG